MCCKGRLSLVLVKCSEMLVIVGHILLSDVRKNSRNHGRKKKSQRQKKKCAKKLWRDVNKTRVTGILEVGYQF